MSAAVQPDPQAAGRASSALWSISIDVTDIDLADDLALMLCQNTNAALPQRKQRPGNVTLLVRCADDLRSIRPLECTLNNAPARISIMAGTSPAFRDADAPTVDVADIRRFYVQADAEIVRCGGEPAKPQVGAKKPDPESTAKPEPETAEKAPRKKPAKPKLDASGHQKPVIRIAAGIVDQLATRAEDVLLNSGLAVFRRGIELVQPASWDVPASGERTTKFAGLHAVTHASLVDLLAQAAAWERYDARSEEWLPTDPPSLMCSVLLSRKGTWRFPSVAGVVTAPTMRRDGSILCKPGYDPATRLFYAVDKTVTLPPIPDRPTREDAELALWLLSDLLAGFPFVGDVDISVALATLLAASVRGALETVPMTALTAPSPGTGKSYFADILAAITTGRPCPVVTAGKSQEETEKRLGGYLLDGVPIIALDNLATGLGGEMLCQIVERPLVMVRRLGGSSSFEIESRAIFLANGNNLVVEGDMTRRVLLARLDAKMERPETREFRFDPVERVLADRGRYLAAAMTVVRAYLAAGQPGKLTPLASYKGWSDLVRSAMVWLGAPDPVESMEASRANDPVLTTLRTALESWHAAFGDVPMTSGGVAAALNGFDPTTAEGERLTVLRAALVSVAAIRGQIDATRLGKWIGSQKGRPTGGLMFEEAGAHGGAKRWIVAQN